MLYDVLLYASEFHFIKQLIRLIMEWNEFLKFGRSVGRLVL